MSASRIQTTVQGPSTTSLTSLTSAISGVTSGVVRASTVAGPPKLTANGRQPPEGSAFANVREIHPTDIVISDNRHLHFHVLVWEKIYGEEIKDYGCLYWNGGGLRLCFGSKKSRQQFVRWFDRYTRIFYGNDEWEMRANAIPFPRDGHIAGHFVSDVPPPAYGSIGQVIYNGGFFGQGQIGTTGNLSAGITSISANPNSTQAVDTHFLDEWAMIVKHSHKAVYRMATGWLFSGAKDGIMFKMLRS